MRFRVYGVYRFIGLRVEGLGFRVRQAFLEVACLAFFKCHTSLEHLDDEFSVVERHLGPNSLALDPKTRALKHQSPKNRKL